MSTQFNFKREEKKYFLTPMQYEILRNAVQPYMQADEHEKYTICNLYYDTDDWQLIRTSIEKPIYKEKLRVRSYGVPAAGDSVFIELKKKYKGTVYKRRITQPAECSGLALARPKLLPNTQIAREIAWFQQQYHTRPKVFIAYDRTALAGIEEPELRMTFDTNLRWRQTDLDLRLGDYGAPILPDSDAILMELKLPGHCPVWLGHLLSELGIFPVSFSKYGSWYQSNIANRNHITTLSKEALYSA